MEPVLMQKARRWGGCQGLHAIPQPHPQGDAGRVPESLPLHEPRSLKGDGWTSSHYFSSLVCFIQK